MYYCCIAVLLYMYYCYGTVYTKRGQIDALSYAKLGSFVASLLVMALYNAIYFTHYYCASFYIVYYTGP